MPVVAVLGEVEYDAAGLARDKTSDMATVLIQGADGRLALLAFTGIRPLPAWNPDARPVPVPARSPPSRPSRTAPRPWSSTWPARLGSWSRVEDLRASPQGWTLARVAGRAAWVTPGGIGPHRECFASLASDRSGPPVPGESDQISQVESSSPTRTTAAAHRSSGPVPTGWRPRRSFGSPMDRIPWGACRASACARTEAFVDFATPSGRPDPNQEDTSAPSCASTTGSGFPRSGSLDPTVRPVGIVRTDEALKLAQEADLDLVEIAPHGTSAGLQAHGLRQVQVRERPEGP